MTFGRIAGSDFMSLVFMGLKDGSWSVDEARDLSLAALSSFADSDCYFLASVVSSLSGRQIVGLMDEDGALLHALSHDVFSGIVGDVLGTRPLGSARDEMAAALGGAVSVRVLPSILGEIESARYLMLVEIAHGLPWLGTGGRSLRRGLWAGVFRDYAARYCRRD